VQRLILATVLAFVIQLAFHVPFGVSPALGFEAGEYSLERWLGFNWDRVRSGAVWQPFTYVMLHGGVLHLFLNMVGLYFFGPSVERLLSTRQFYRFYFFCGAAGVSIGLALAYLVDPTTIYNPVVGASGAVFGVLVAFAVAQPNAEIILFPLPIPLYARALIWLTAIINVASFALGQGLTPATHLGGMIAGFAYIKSAPTLRDTWDRLRGRSNRPRNTIDQIGQAVDNIFKFDKERRRRR
jgi:membrane associated rhomboid family serine protease